MAPNSWHEIGTARPAGAEVSSRTRDILAAIEANEDFSLLEIRFVALKGVPTDVLVLRCTSDGVPSKNRVGIQFQEPLAILISNDSAALPEVRALRRDFPITLHQNSVPDGEPCSLCLYEQKPIAVLRTWTSPGFLRRIQWWLTETANGRLHQADQPLEQLFFDSPHDVVLPAGYLTYTDHSNDTLVVADVVQRFASNDVARQNPRYTLFLEPPSQRTQASTAIRLISLYLSPIVHGAIEREPSTLGALDDQVRARGATVIDLMINHIKQYVGSGRDSEGQYRHTVLLLVTPLRRTPEGPIETVQTRAFWIDVDMLIIGERAGAIVRDRDHPSRYYIDYRLGNVTSPTEWRALELLPLSVSMRPDAAAARCMSGVKDRGPRGVLAGAGALGSAMIDLWRRSGWGTWSVIDGDHLKPHNLIRHTSHWLGYSKADAVARHDANVWHSEGLIQAISGDAADINDVAVQAALGDAELIVDATTTFEVPRRLANSDFTGRVVSTFLTPNGLDAALIAESRTRDCRVDALEAQYWRALLTQEWGKTHLEMATQRFRSGASCRDVSTVMAYSSILAHASTLAEQVRALPAEGIIRIWKRDPGRGSVATYDVAIEVSMLSPLGDLVVVWDRGTLKKVRDYRCDALPAETGGVLVGYHDLNERRIYVVDALDAPPDSIGTPESFERGVQDLRARVEAIHARSGGHIVYLGEWHSHPQGHDAAESQPDVVQLMYLGKLLGREDLPALMFIVAGDDYQWLMARSEL